MAAGFTMPQLAGRALRSTPRHCGPGIAGFNVINTLDPMKATLIPEFYVIYGAF